MRERLLTTRGLPLPQGDLDWIDRAFKAFYDDGPKIDYYGARPLDAIRPSYRQLMTMKDVTGRYRSFLATEGGFAFVKEMQMNNLIVPVVGDFGGPARCTASATTFARTRIASTCSTRRTSAST